MDLVCSKNIFSNEVNKYIYKILNNKSYYLYLTNSSIVNHERKKSLLLNKLFNENPNVTSLENFLNFCSNEVHKSKNYLSNMDISYILEKVMDDYFKDEKEKNKFQNIHHSLLQLYKLLIFNGVYYIPQKTRVAISNYNSITESHIFNLYNKLMLIIVEIIDAFISGKNTYSNNNLGIEIAAPTGTDDKFDVFTNAYRNQIYKKIFEIDTLILDGFLYLNSSIMFIAKTAVALNKKVILITKDLATDINAKFLINEIKDKVSITSDDIKFITINSSTKLSLELEHLSNNFYGNINYTENIMESNKTLTADKSIKVIKPFLHRSQELKFVAQQISKILAQANTDDPYILENIIKNDLVVICGKNHNKLAEELDRELKRYGLFIYRGLPNSILEKEVSNKNRKKIYYCLDDFLASDIYYCDGQKLDTDEKMFYFYNAYKRITIEKQNPLLISTPVLEYIFQLYNILLDGISTKRFKLLLFSNWYYHTGISKIKWDKYIGTFQKIESYFKDDVPIDNWAMQIKDILSYKDEIKNNPLYKFHPFNSVSSDELKFLLDLLKELNILINLLSITKGNVQHHLEFLRKNIIKSDNIFSDSYIHLTEEQQIIKKFFNTLKSIVSDSTISYLDSNCFYKHLKLLFFNADEFNGSKKNDVLKLNFSNMSNLKNYKHTFLISCENNNYPRKNNNKFPLTNSITKILTDKKYKLNIPNLPFKTDDFHIKLEKYLFKNVIDCTTENIYYTCSQYTGKSKNSFSIYIEDIATAFNSEVKFTDSKIVYPLKDNDTNTFEPPPIYVTPKNEYTLKELVTYILCPKLYYHMYVKPKLLVYTSKGQLRLYAKAVMYSDLLRRFMNYNYTNKKWYLSNGKDVYRVLETLSDECLKQNCRYFDCLQMSDLIDIKEKNLSRIIKLIEEYIIQELEYHKYTIVNSKGKIHTCSDFNLKLEYDTAIFSDKKGSRKIEQNNIFLDFLTLKCTNRQIKEKHYNEMLKLLQENNKFTDRIFFANRIINKINIQFDSGVSNFIYGNDGGIERVEYLKEKILNADFSKVKSCPSNFCSYCIVKNTCMGGKETQNKLEVIE